MSKYSDVEIQTAKRLRDAGYKWIARYEHGLVCAFAEKPYKKERYWLSDGKYVIAVGPFTPIFQGIKWSDNDPTCIENIINPQILDNISLKLNYSKRSSAI